MTPERWAQIEEIFHRAAECDPETRASLLDESCNGDEELRRAVEVLLASEENARDDMRAAVHAGLDAMTFPLVGEIVSHHRILTGLGGGGMGLVYLAEDLKLGRKVALKFLPEESAKDPLALARFEREARSASALEHPNICPIYEFGEHEGRPFLVMQFLEGRTLREHLATSDHRNPPFELPKFLDLAVQIAEGLEIAHHHGIIHRDIKPANIFITDEGQAKILDFGLAKLAAGDTVEKQLLDESKELSPGSGAESSPQATPDTLLSRTGVAMGTAGYMSPEQARGEKLDARTDLFSFGLVLYEMATGQRAFKGDTREELHQAILQQTPAPIRQLNPELSSKLEAIIGKALKKDRSERYQSATELAADLRVFSVQLPPKSRAIRLLTTLAAVLVLSSAAIIFRLTKQQRSSENALPEVKFKQLTINSSENPVKSGSISPDGKYLAYVDRQGMHVQEIETGATHIVPQPDALGKDKVVWEILDIAWFPDSRNFVANVHPATESPAEWASPTTSIWKFSRLGEAPQRLRDGAIAWEVMPDGSVSIGTNKESWLMGPNGEHASKLFDPERNSEIIGPLALSFADKNIVLYVKHSAEGDAVLTQDLRGGPPVTLFTPEETKRIPGDFAWLPDGRLVYQVVEDRSSPSFLQNTCNFWSWQLDPHTGKPVQKARRLTNWTGFCSSNINATADGKRIAFLQRSASRGTAYIAELAPGGRGILNSRHFTMEEADDAITAWTADSKSVIFVSNRPDRYEVYKQVLNSDTPHLLATIPRGANEQALLTPDGEWVILTTYPFDSPAEPNRIERIPIGGGPPELILKSRENLPTGYDCALLPSHRCVLFDLSEDHKRMTISDFDPLGGRGAELARVDLDPHFDPNLSYAMATLSRDGTRFAVALSRTGPIEVHSLTDRSIQVIRPKGTIDMLNPIWAPDGKAFYLSNRTKDGMELLYMDFQGHTKVILKNNDRTWCVPSPDGKYLAINNEQQIANMWMMENF